MSKINGEKARSAIARRNRTARRVKDRARLAEIRSKGSKTTTNTTTPQSESRAKG